MAVSTSRELGTEICDVLGLKNCTLLNIHIKADSLVSVVARFCPEKDGAKQLPAILKRFNLVPIEGPLKATEFGPDANPFKMQEMEPK